MNIDREKIIRSAFVILAILVIVGALTMIRRHNSLSLEEYAKEHPEFSETAEETESSGTEETEETENLQNTSKNDISSELTGALLNSDTMKEQRITYAEGFYSEPLSANLQRYITGVSFSPDLKETDVPMEGTENSLETSASLDTSVTCDDLRYLHILHYDFDGNLAEGELICNEIIAQDLLEIFYELYRNEYQLGKVHLADEYDGDAVLSMEDNNSVCLNSDGQEMSSDGHALGLSVDINPAYNPYVTYEEDGSEQILPTSALSYVDRTKSFPYKIDETDLCYRLFTQHGFTWGGNRNSYKSYQHFQFSPRK